MSASASTSATAAFDEDLAAAFHLAELENIDLQEPFDSSNSYYGNSSCDDYDHDKYDNYDDFSLSPAPTRKARPRRSSKKNRSKPSIKGPPLSKVTLPLIDNPRPLIFSHEILRLICSHLSQPTLRHSVSLVCKSWNRASADYIHRVAVWTPLRPMFRDRLLEEMKTVKSLECWFEAEPGVPTFANSALVERSTTYSQWEEFLNAILAPLPKQKCSDIETQYDSNNILSKCKDQLVKKKTPTCLFHYIDHLSINGHYIRYDSIVGRLQSHFQFLRTISFQIQTGPYNIRLFQILDNAPRLLEFIVNSPLRYGLISAGDKEDLLPDIPSPPPFNSETAHFPREPKIVPPPKRYSKRYALRVFDVERCVVGQRVLERIVSTCPELKILKAAEDNPIYQSDQTRPFDYDHVRLINHIKEMCPQLEWYGAIKGSANVEAREHLQRIYTHFPDTKFLSLSAGYSNNYTIPTYAPLLCNITVLNFIRSNGYHSSCLINQILCFTPRLLHLIAPNSKFQPSYLYVPSAPDPPVPGQRYPVLPSSSDQGDSNKIWACRKLRSCELGIATNHGLKPFVDYINRNDLFLNLTNLRLSFDNLYMGQLMEFPHTYKELEKKVKEADANSKGQDYRDRHYFAAKTALECRRFENLLLSLRCLFSLEILKMKTLTIPGMLNYSDFEFLRRQQIGNSETFWPQLQAFHLQYISSPLFNNYHSVVLGAQAIRPEVEFVIIQISQVVW
ncbi:hypothetical protein BX616_005956 [Lobosporangium transversale]|nr:hypothetical protein BX616_005956 [Lobosporangium transversale]